MRSCPLLSYLPQSWVKQGSAHSRSSDENPATVTFPLPMDAWPLLLPTPSRPCSGKSEQRAATIFPAKHGTCSMHITHLQPISPKFSSGLGFLHPFTAQAAWAPGGCEKTAGGLQEHPLASKCPGLLWPVLMCIAAASPGPGDDFILPSFRMEPYINMGKRRGPQRVREVKTISACLVSSSTFWFCLKHCAMSPRLFLSP